MQFTLPQEILTGNTLHIARGDTIDQKALTEKLTALGYARTEQVDAPCQFSVRGAIFDIFSPQNPLPLRIEFWGDEIDSMSWFEPETQARGRAEGEAPCGCRQARQRRFAAQYRHVFSADLSADSDAVRLL